MISELVQPNKSAVTEHHWENDHEIGKNLHNSQTMEGLRQNGSSPERERGYLLSTILVRFLDNHHTTLWGKCTKQCGIPCQIPDRTPHLRNEVKCGALVIGSKEISSPLKEGLGQNIGFAKKSACSATSQKKKMLD